LPAAELYEHAHTQMNMIRTLHLAVVGLSITFVFVSSPIPISNPNPLDTSTTVEELLVKMQ